MYTSGRSLRASSRASPLNARSRASALVILAPPTLATTGDFALEMLRYASATSFADDAGPGSGGTLLDAPFAAAISR